MTAAPSRQSGLILWACLLFLLAAAGLGWYGSARAARQAALLKQSATLAQAKEALLAYALMDETRPGRLPCPDLVGDGVSPLLARDDCDAYLGFLPWKTLDVGEKFDRTGSPLRYVVSPGFSGDRQGLPLNSDSAGGLQVQMDGWQHSAAVALIIAPGGALDTVNADGDPFFRAGRSAAEDDNDAILIVSRMELLAAVEKRVAGELRRCLEAQAASRSDHRYPWPAALTSSDYRADGLSRFGRVPQTQPTAGPEALLADNRQALLGLLDTLANSRPGSEQLALLKQLGERLTEQRNLADALFFSANSLKQAADQALAALHRLQSGTDSATANDRISRSEGSSLRNASQAAELALSLLRQLLYDSGLDPFPASLARLSAQVSAQLATSVDASALLAASKESQRLLAASISPHPDIAPPLARALDAAVSAQNAALAAVASTAEGALLAAAQGAVRSLLQAMSEVDAAIGNSRINRRAAEIGDLASALALEAASWPAGGPLPAAGSSALLTLQAAIRELSGGPAAVQTARASTLQAIRDVLDAAAASLALPDLAPLQKSLSALQQAVADSQSITGQVGLSSLDAGLAPYRSASQRFAAIDTQEPRPTQQSITPYALNLQSSTVDLAFWAQTSSEHAARLAALAKASPLSASSDPAKATPLASSSYQGAVTALASLSGSTGAISVLQNYLAKPTSSNLGKLNSALSKTRGLLETVLSRAVDLDRELSSTLAAADPVIWASRECDFLRPNISSWWQNNLWRASLFYQFGHPLAGSPGQLRVNGHGGYRLVTLAAGAALPGQQRDRRNVADFFEGANAHPSRDGSASAPASDFSQAPPTSTANDRLAY